MPKNNDVRVDDYLRSVISCETVSLMAGKSCRLLACLLRGADNAPTWAAHESGRHNVDITPRGPVGD